MKAYSPAALADRWDCSEQKVRNMIASGSLPAFRLDGKLWRIRAKDVEDFECQSGGLPDSRENIASPGMMEDGAGIALEPATERKPPAARLLSMPKLRALQGQR